MVSVFAPCGCCLDTRFVVALATTALLLVFSFKFFKKSLVGRLIYFTFLFVLLVVIGSATALYVNSDLRAWFFSKFFTVVARGNELDIFRCGLLANVSGRVLEIGPGPGTNFRCWGANSSITEWVGVDSNKYFESPLLEEANARGINFPMEMQWVGADGSGVKLEDRSFDAVVATHALCSIDNLDSLFSSISRSLKDGGSYYFMEHVAAQPNTTTATLQSIFAAPLTVIGNGCRFKDLWTVLHDAAAPAGSFSGYSLVIERFDAPVPIMAPHIKGSLRKP